MPLHYTLRQLEYFVAVGESGSIARAAEQVNVSSPSISTAIVQLEEEFGLQLFVRKHAHGLWLTQAGHQFMVQAQLVLQEALRLNDLASDITGKVRGPLRIGCLVTMAQLILPQLRRWFQDRYPEAEISQFEMDQAAIFDMLRRAKIDLALTYRFGVPSDLTFRPLIKLQPFAVFSPDHPLADAASVSPRDLLDYPMVLLDLPHSVDSFLSFFKGLRGNPVIAERTRDMAVMRAMVANGFGFSIVNIHPKSDESQDGKKLCFVPISGEANQIELGVITAERAAASLTVQAFVEHCADHIESLCRPKDAQQKDRT